MKSELVCFVTSGRDDGIIGTDQIAHGATDACITRVCFLPDAVIYGEDIARAFRKVESGLNHPLAKNTQLYGINRAYRRAPSAKVALFFTPEDLPGEIFDA